VPVPTETAPAEAPSQRWRLTRKAMESVLLRVKEAAKLLRVSTWTVYRWIDEGHLRATKIGRGSLRVFWTSVSGLIGDVDDRSRIAGKPSPSHQVRRGKVIRRGKKR
jgi:excisionase family DNA binding protein